MADDEDHGDNRPDDMILDEKVVKMGEELASIMRKRKGLNEEAKTIYSNADKLGIPPAALQVAVRLVRVLDKDDRRAYQKGVNRVLKALEPAAADLFAEDVERVAKRKAAKKARDDKAKAKAGGETPEQQERRLAADLNPRSDPKRGGAGKGRKPKATVAETATVDPATLNAAQEQVDGGAVLDGMIDGIPKSQSQIAREIAEQAGTDK